LSKSFQQWGVTNKEVLKMAIVKIELEVTDGEVTNVCIDGERTAPTAELVIEAAHELKYVTTILSYTTSKGVESAGEDTDCADEDVGTSGKQVYAARMAAARQCCHLVWQSGRWVEKCKTC
jgi:hypothetical protein